MVAGDFAQTCLAPATSLHAQPIFHPSLDLLTEHAAGTLPLAQTACLSAHLNYCEQCRRSVANLQNVGGALFGNLSAEPVSENVLDFVLARLDESAPLSYSAAEAASTGRTPAILQRLMKGDFSDLSWTKIILDLRKTCLHPDLP